MAGTQISNNRKIQKVMPLLLQLEKDKNDYLPEAVSFGPYHHGEPKLAFVEAFKPTAADLFISGGRENKEFYYNKVLGIIGEVRNCYVQTSMGEFSDAYLAEMMLHDASLIIIYMEITAPAKKQELDDLLVKKLLAMTEHLGMLTLEILSRDLHLLDNQIPLRVVKLLINLRDGKGRGDELVNRFLNMSFFGEYSQECLQQQEEEEPLHLLEASHRLLVSGSGQLDAREDRTGARNCCIRRCLLPCSRVEANEPKDSIKSMITNFRSATGLKAKGIHFRPSPTQFLNDVNFKSHLLYASLQLPQYGVSTRTKVVLKNMVAYELSPNSPAMGEILSYINLMKSLLERPEDAKELREKKIIYNMLGSDEEVLNVFKDINTHGSENGNLFKHVKDEIHAHCHSRAKTWMAEHIHNNLRSSWTMTEFLAAIALTTRKKVIDDLRFESCIHPDGNRLRRSRLL